MTLTHVPTTLSDLWQRMDAAWAELGLDEHRPDPARLAAFYRHPVWALNGAFAEADPLSRAQRLALVRWLAVRTPARILDYGGGFGTVARMLAANLPCTPVEIYEPYPAPAALVRAEAYPNLQYVAHLSGSYAAIICMDVLEHLRDPLTPLAALTAALAPGGLLVLANNFYPVIRCHLPETFHLRYSFELFASAMGLRRIGRIPGSSALAYRLMDYAPPNWRYLRRIEWLSRCAYPVLRSAHRAYRILRRRAPGVI